MTSEKILIERDKLEELLERLSQIEREITKLYQEIANLYIKEDEPTEEEKRIIEKRLKEEEIPLDKVLKELKR